MDIAGNCKSLIRKLQLMVHIFERKESAMVWHYKSAGNLGLQKTNKLLEVWNNLKMCLLMTPCLSNVLKTLLKLNQRKKERWMISCWALENGNHSSDEDMFLAIDNVVKMEVIYSSHWLFVLAYVFLRIIKSS